MPRFEPRIFAADEREGIDTIFMVPTMFIRLMKLPEDVQEIADAAAPHHPCRRALSAESSAMIEQTR